MESNILNKPVIVKKFHVASVVNRPYCTIECQTAELLLSLLLDYNFEKAVYNPDGSLRYLRYKHKSFDMEIAIVKFC